MDTKTASKPVSTNLWSWQKPLDTFRLDDVYLSGRFPQFSFTFNPISTFSFNRKKRRNQNSPKRQTPNTDRSDRSLDSRRLSNSDDLEEYYNYSVLNSNSAFPCRDVPKIVQDTGVTLTYHVSIPIPHIEQQNPRKSALGRTRPMSSRDTDNILAEVRKSSCKTAEPINLNKLHQVPLSSEWFEEPVTVPNLQIYQGKTVEPSVVMGFLSHLDDSNSTWKTVFVTLDRGFLACYEDSLKIKPLKHPYGDKLIKRVLLKDSNVFSHDDNLSVVTMRNLEKHRKITRWIRAKCPGLKAMVRPYPNAETQVTSFVKDGEEMEIFIKPFSGYYCLTDGRGYICRSVKDVTWVEIDEPTQLTTWVCVNSPGSKVPIRANPNVGDPALSYLLHGECIEVYCRTASGFFQLCDGRGYVNKHTRNVEFQAVSEPDEARILRLQRVRKEQGKQTFVFQPLDAAITGMSVDEWTKSLKHHMVFASEHYEMDQSGLPLSGIDADNLATNARMSIVTSIRASLGGLGKSRVSTPKSGRVQEDRAH